MVGWIIALVFVLLAAGSAAWAAWRAAPFVPSWNRDVVRLLTIAGVKPGELVIDPGAGDGRIVITAVKKFQARAVGYEIALIPYLLGWCRLRWSHVQHQVEWRFRDFFQANFSAAAVVACFLTPRAMEKLGQKLAKELPAGARVVSFAFAIPGWVPIKVDKPTPKHVRIFLYQWPQSAPPGD